MGLLLGAALAFSQLISPASPTFDGQRAHRDVEAQVALGPRLPGTKAHAQGVAYIQSELQKAGWVSQIIEGTYQNQTVKNILATRQNPSPRLLLGAHYDSRFHADNDPDPANHAQPVPGANDGASGVAVLLELARVLPRENTNVGLVFFDAEDNGNIPGWDWIYGSRAFARDMTFTPEAFILVDMIGDTDLNIHKEGNSDPQLTQQLWSVADRLGYGDVFLPDTKYYILDDHIPFIEKGIRSVDIIDMDYAYWHTVSDTPDKVSPKSLQIIGDVLLAWLQEYLQ